MVYMIVSVVVIIIFYFSHLFYLSLLAHIPNNNNVPVGFLSLEVVMLLAIFSTLGATMFIVVLIFSIESMPLGDHLTL